MLRGIDRLRLELDRLRRPLSASITPTPGGPAVEVRVGDELEIAYAGEARHVRVLAVTPAGLRCWDVGKSAIRCFKFTNIGAAERPPETDAAALG